MDSAKSSKAKERVTNINAGGLFTFSDIDPRTPPVVVTTTAAKSATYAALCGSCLREDPTSRPTFAQVVRMLEDLITNK